MDCFQDFCLNCDRQATNDNYCSQSCKLADLGKASSPSSPTFPSTSSSTPSSPSTRYKQPATTHQYHHHQDWTRTYTQPTASSDHQSPRSSYFMRPPPQKEGSRPTYHRAHRSLTPSSSRSSLDSTSNSSTGSRNSNALSAQAKQELQEYFHAFDAAKASKRRQSTW